MSLRVVITNIFILYQFTSTPVRLGMRTITPDIPNHLLSLVEARRGKRRDPHFLARHRVRPRDFTGHGQLPFPVLMPFILQKTVPAIHRHWQEFLDDLAQGEIFEPLTAGAVTPARAKLPDSAFRELNRDGVLPTVYGPEHPSQRGRVAPPHGHRPFVDASARQPGVGPGVWLERNHPSKRGHRPRDPEARLSVVFDWRNRIGLDARLEPSTVGEVALAIQPWEQVPPGEMAIFDRGFSGYRYFALVSQRRAHFIGRCSTGSFRAAQGLLRLNRANQSKGVWLFAPADQKGECRRRGLPLQMQVRVVSVRWQTGEWDVPATALLDEALYPTEEFLTVSHWRWVHETF